MISHRLLYFINHSRRQRSEQAEPGVGARAEQHPVPEVLHKVRARQASQGLVSVRRLRGRRDGLVRGQSRVSTHVKATK